MPEGSSSENQAPMINPVSYQISPPEEFDFSKPTEWIKWIRRFERFRSASGLSKRDEESLVNTLLYSMGSKSDDILATFGLTTEDSKKYDVVKDKFDGYFVKRRNIIFERAKFHRRKQENGGAVDSFITDLYGLAEHCQFGLLHDEMIRDRIVVGLADQKLSEKVQLDADLTLEKAIKSESVRSQQSIVRGQEDASQPAKVDRVHKSKPQKSLRTSLNPQQKTHKQSVGQNDVSNDICKRCGKSPAHKRTQCPAKDAHCRKCKKKGHFQAVCLSGKVNTVVDDELTYFLWCSWFRRN